METAGIRGIALRLCDWIVRLAYVNGLWLGFSLLGGVVLGFFSSTTSHVCCHEKVVHE